ncbi:MAG: hypothetical protein ACFFCI_08900 [Promethearchaeota archaeon]
MNLKVRTMLEQLFTAFTKKYNDPIKSWNRFLEFIAIDNFFPILAELDYNLAWFCENKEFLESVMDIYNSQCLKSDYYDHLGELYWDKILSKKYISQTSNSYLISPSYTKRIMEDNNKNRKRTILVKAVGSGRTIMEYHKYYSNSIFFGIEPDLRLYRIALTNCLIHNIPAYLLHANLQKYEVDISTKEGNYNWRFYNKWRSQMNNMLPKIKK